MELNRLRGTTTYVDATLTRAHVLALLETLTVGQIEARSGVNRRCIRLLVGAIEGEPQTRRITKRTAAALASVTPARIGPEAHGLVDAVGTQRRLRALYALGHDAKSMAHELGASTRTMWTLLTWPEHPQVTADLRSRVVELYDRLSLVVPPPSRYRTRAVHLAQRRGWAPPLAWDDELIDDPAATPQLDVEASGDVVDEAAVQRAVSGDRSVRLSAADKDEAVKRLHGRGLLDSGIGIVLGLPASAVQHVRWRLGLASNHSNVYAGYGDLTPRQINRKKAS